MSHKGYVLIEVLIASMLISMAASGLCIGIMQGIRAEQTIRKTDQLYRPFQLLRMRASQDLRNSITLKSYPFIGKADEMTFPVRINTNTLKRVRYYVKDMQLYRSTINLPEKFTSEPPSQQVIMRDLESVEFEYAFLDEEERLEFESDWPEEPYYGVPGAVKIHIKPIGHAQTLSKLVSIPQGRFGHFDSSSGGPL